MKKTLYPTKTHRPVEALRIALGLDGRITLRWRRSIEHDE
jgi:hypothetical protein